jgi:microcystin-dependent protein
LGLLGETHNWEEAGDLTPEQCAALAEEMWWTFTTGGGCVMIGSVQAYAVATLPDGVLPCDGGQHLRVDYPALYDALDPAFIVDADHFVTPNLADRVIMGGGAIGETGGEASHTLIAAEMPAHTHAIDNGYGPNVGGAYTGEIPCLDALPTYTVTSSAGDGQPHENRPPYLRLRFGMVAR